MYEQYLNQAGLTPEQSQIYEILVKNGPLKAGKISQKTPLKRGLVYKVLDQLLEIGLIDKQDETEKVAVFVPKHPLKLKELAEKKEQQAKDAQAVLQGILPSLVSDFNLAGQKPGVVFFEGLEGVKKILIDSLSAKSQIYSYIDNETANKYFGEINREYVKKRLAAGISKKMIALDSEYVRKMVSSSSPELTELRVVKPIKFQSLAVVMQIYDNKISYITLKGSEKIIGILIEDNYIASMHKILFEIMWSSALLIKKDQSKSVVGEPTTDEEKKINEI